MPGALIQTLKPTPMLPKRVPENTTRVNDDPVIAESSLDPPSQSPQPDEDASTVMQHLLPRKFRPPTKPITIKGSNKVVYELFNFFLF